ncbi:MAG: cation diffusion facilitator family transporter [Patescibacteria group bacterium]|nr:cation diffusion facilitator family transporter [Patescibacteria group bacterium]
MNDKNQIKPIGQKSVFIAVLGDFFVMILKFFGFIFTGSVVFLSEATHSLVDTANQAILLLGIKRSEKPADEKFYYGYRQERFFWALLSAVGIFFIGAGATIYSGINSFIKNEPLFFNGWVLTILVFSFFIEGYSFFTALREAKHLAGKKHNLYRFIKHSTDPTILAVMYEDSAALIGILIAFFSILLIKITGLSYWDGLGSIFIGLLLGAVAIILMKINKDFLMNKAAPKHIEEEIEELLSKQKLVDSVHDFKTVMIGTDGVILKAETEINGQVLAQKIFKSRNFKREFQELKDYDDFVRFCFDYSDEVVRTLGHEIDKLEKEIVEEVPEVKHIDIEAN